MPSRHRVPVWLMGLTNLSYGLYGGVIAFAAPQLLGDRHVPESSIAGLTAVAFSPGFWAFLVSPVLDVRFSRRWYAVVLAVIASLSLVVAFLNLDHPWRRRPSACGLMAIPVHLRTSSVESGQDLVSIQAQDFASRFVLIKLRPRYFGSRIANLLSAQRGRL
jgi:MFS family permease